MKRAFLTAATLFFICLFLITMFLKTDRLNDFLGEFDWKTVPQKIKFFLTQSDIPESDVGTLVWKTHYDNARIWLKKDLLSNYEMYGSHSPAWDQKVVELLGDYADLGYTEWEDTDLVEHVLAQAGELIELGCDDPYIQFIQARATFVHRDPSDGRVLLEKSFARMEESEYPAYRKFRAAEELMEAFEWVKIRGEKLRSLKRLAMMYLGKAAGDKTFANGNQRFYIANINNLWSGRKSKMPENAELLMYELNNTPDADPWIKLIIQGYYHMSKGWEARGSKVARLVQEKKWGTFRDEIKQARDCFTRAHTMHPEFPEAASLMISIAMTDGSSDQEIRQWFDRSVAAQFDYMKSYKRYFWSLRPRWGGSHEKMLQLGVECLNTGRFDTPVPDKFLKALWQIGSELPDWRTPYRAPGTFENLQKFFTGKLKEPGTSPDEFYWPTVQAVTYWAAGHYGESKKIFDDLGDTVSMKGFGAFNVTKNEVFGEISLYTSPFKEVALQASELYSDNQSLEALPYFEDLRTNLQSDPNALQLLNNRIAVLTLKQNYLNGDWVNLIPAPDLAGWDMEGGSWEVEPDGTLKGTSDGHNKNLMLLGQLNVMGNYEIQGDIETSYRAAIIMGYIRGSMGKEFVSFSFDIPTERAYLCEGFTFGPNALREKISPQEKSNFLVRVTDNRITAVLNGKEVFTEQLPDYQGYSPHNGCIGLGHYYGRVPGYHIRYRNLQIRKID